MCGIAGYFSYNKLIKQSTIVDMCQELSHRGPDDYGTYIYENEKLQVALGHTRLSIIDLSSGGHQPMIFNHLHIVFNGEIYNYAEIKDKLLKLGYDFKSNSDTEVILKAFCEWGVAAVNLFIGMFSFVLLDTETQKMYCFRDRAGVKPFYYHKVNGDFIWASELKSLLKYPGFIKQIEPNALKLYLQYGFIPAPYTIYTNTYKLKPGNYLEVDLATGKISENTYWDVNDYYKSPKVSIDEKQSLEELEELLISSCNYRMVSDVPVGVFLSGGYDSTTVAALLQKNQPNRLKTFTIGFKESGFDEAPFAKDIANYLGTEHHELYCSEQDAKDVIPLLSSIYDEPFGDSSAIPTYLVSKMAKEHVTVVLSADGGDETFFGYNRYPDIVNRFNKINKFSAFKRRVIRSILPIAKVLYRNNYQKQRNIEILKRSLNSRMPSMQDLNSWYIQRFSATELEKLLVKSETAFDGVNTYFNQTDIEKMDPVDQLLSTDYKTYLVDDILTKVDRATMAVSIEGREPLLDHRLIEFAAQLPLELKYKNKTQKYLLKQIAYKYLPKTLLDRPKSGFAIPLQKWFRTDMKYLLDEFLGEDLLKQQGIFNPLYVKSLLKYYYDGQDSVFEKIWFLLMFQMWHQKWINGEGNLG